MKIYNGYERIDLTEGMRHKGEPRGPDNREWFAGEQLIAMEYYRPEKLKILYSYTADDYSGEIYGVAVWDEGEKDQRFVFWTDSFGTCSGCDCLEGNGNGYEYIEDVLKNNTWQFLSLEDMYEYLDEPHERLYWSMGVDSVKNWISSSPRWNDLEPCPFCGSHVVIYRARYFYTSTLYHPLNGCILSNLREPIAECKLVEKWNGRAHII